MWIFNVDGSEVEMCGNGICCLVCYLVDIDGDVFGWCWDIEIFVGMICFELMVDCQLWVDMGLLFFILEVIFIIVMFEDGFLQGVLLLEDE